MNNKIKYLKDYTPLPWTVRQVDLHFDIRSDEVLVTSRLNIEALRSGEVLVLDGEAELLRVVLNGKLLSSSQDYRIDAHQLIIGDVTMDKLELEIVTKLYPKTNKSLMGLYESSGGLFTQCESEGFRKISYFFDRPDIMSEYRVTIEADRDDYPVLLSNGNKIASGEKEANRHFVTWHDPYRKPSYLFALVAGKLACKEDKFITVSGKEVTIHFFCQLKDIDKVDFAISALKKAMAWDEARFKLEYDLDIFMVVAVDDFNMGAMENKGLNIFNTKYVLATSETATDKDFSDVEAVIGHEYFHNYTGNRVTCRDWFQLTLKEGLTVFREQEFSADMASRVARRIQAVKFLREFQFSEDMGPLSHPIRPEQYEQINNFYTMTVYEKGAEVIRMLHTILGEAGFQKGMQLYFERHDGQAVTCEDFLAAMMDANELQIPEFMRWYSYAGTPVVSVKKYFDQDKKKVLLKFKQKIPDKKKEALLIPIRMGFLTHDGRAQKYQLEETETWQEENVFLLKDKLAEITFKLSDDSNPILSIGRGFSAPIKLKYKQSEHELMTLMLHDSDEFIRFEASQRLYKKYIKRFFKAKNLGRPYPPIWVLTSKVNQLIAEEEDAALLSLMLELPSFNELLEDLAPVDPVILQKVILDFRKALVTDCVSSMKNKYYQLVAYEQSDPFGVAEKYHPKLEWVRALINLLRCYLCSVDKKFLAKLTEEYSQIATNMTHRIGVLAAIKHTDSEIKDALMADFTEQFKEEELVLDKYFALIASSFAKNTMKKVRNSLKSPYFDLTNPNKVRSLLVTFTRNPLFFHQTDGKGYRLISQLIVKIEKFNPMMAARLVDSFKVADKLDEHHKHLINKQMKWLLNKVESNDVIEITNKIYNSTG